MINCYWCDSTKEEATGKTNGCCHVVPSRAVEIFNQERFLVEQPTMKHAEWKRHGENALRALEAVVVVKH